jgi:2-desacetyl-2-hydroxyethyl bacteriochlorophyllide A dehydrogenase
MRAVQLRQPSQFDVIALPAPPDPGPGQALVRTLRIGVCGTDLHAYRGRQPFFEYPRILGHELAVEVLALGPDTDTTGVRIGDRCAVEPYLNCGTCIACRRGKPNCCASLQTLGVHTDGGMRDQWLVPAHKLHPANDLDLDALALIETLGIGAHAVDRAQIQPDEHALIIGAGPIGLSVLQFAKLVARETIVMDVSESRRGFAHTTMGAKHTIDAGAGALDGVRAFTNGDLPTVVFDATGNPASMAAAFDFVAPGGKLVFVGLVQADIAFNDPHLHRREITLLASRNALPRDFTRIIGLVRAGQVDTRPWITHRLTPETLDARFPELLQPERGVLKAMVDWAGSGSDPFVSQPLAFETKA